METVQHTEYWKPKSTKVGWLMLEWCRLCVIQDQQTRGNQEEKICGENH